MQSQQVLPFELVGQVAATGRTYTQHAAAIADDSNYLSIRLLMEATGLQCQTICTTWMQSQGASCPIKLQNVGTTHSHWFYFGNAWDQYRCHEIYINNTWHTHTYNTVFFKHKYLTMPTLTLADTLIRAAENLTPSIAGIIPPPNMTTDTIDQLIHIFKQEAETAKNDSTFQRVFKERAHAERVLTKAELNPTPTTTPSAAPTTNPTTSFPDLKIEYPDSDVGRPWQTPVVSQDDHESVSPPSANTHHQRRGRTIIEDFLFHMMDVLTPTQPFTA